MASNPAIDRLREAWEAARSDDVISISEADAGAILDEYDALSAAYDALEPLEDLHPWVVKDEDGDDVCAWCKKWRCATVSASTNPKDREYACKSRALALKAVKK